MNLDNSDSALLCEPDLGFIVEGGDGGTGRFSSDENENVEMGLVINLGFEIALFRTRRFRDLDGLESWECMQPILYLLLVI